MSRVYLGLGSNLGDRLENLRRAVGEIRGTDHLSLLRASSIYETAPWGYTDQPWFLNAVVEVGTSLDPAGLLKAVKAAEAKLGRTAGDRWGPRPIDIDILLFDDLTLDEPHLVIPHPHICERLFVLAPLADLLPHWKCPNGETASELAYRLWDEKEIALFPGDLLDR